MRAQNDDQAALMLRCRNHMEKLERAGGRLDALEPEEAQDLMDMIALHQEQEPSGNTVAYVPGAYGA